jgi:hypothetical protein
MTTEIRTALAAILAESHLAQADSSKERLEHSTYMDKGSKEVLWAIYFAHLHAAETLTERAEALLERLPNV